MRQPQRKDLRASIKPHLRSRLLADTLPYPIHVSHPTARPSCILRHSFSRVRVPGIWAAAVHNLKYLQPTNSNPPTSTRYPPPHQISTTFYCAAGDH